MRRMEFGLYDQLMVELRNEDPLRPRLSKPSTNFRPNLDPGLKVALTLRHLASGTTYRNMQYADYKFIYIDASGNGSASDAQIYNASDLKDGLERNLIMGFPGPDPLPNDFARAGPSGSGSRR